MRHGTWIAKLIPMAVPSPETRALVSQLIAFNTVSRDSNLGLIEWVRDYLARFGVTSRLTYDAGRNKANLFATLGDGRDSGLVISGHTDVVPVDGQAWSSDPFTLVERDGRLYGRGAADMKSFIAVALATVPRFLAAQRPFHLAFTYDEEVGCLGVRRLLADLAEAGIKPSGCIVGEPTSMAVAIGHKGGRTLRCRVHGREAHAALAPKAVNAIEYAARLIVAMREAAERFTVREARDATYDVPHSTLMTGVISGGTAANIVPRECQFRFGIRYLPHSDPEELIADIRDYAARVLLPEMRAIAPEADIVFEPVGDVPHFEIDAAAPLARYVGERVDSGGTTAHVVFGSEAGLFQRAGIPAVLCGPGNIEQAHKPDEFISLDQIAQCEAFMRRLAADSGFN
jgi:acetylornithine deacetylase